MQIPSYSRRRADRGDEAMTPMIDVVFLLLIFFICAAAGQVKEAVLPTEMSRQAAWRRSRRPIAIPGSWTSG